jgi:tetrapyrrole methylase family protein/MazG family protein
VTSFDYLYESASSLEEVYAGIVEILVKSPGDVVYAVPGSPVVLERSVALLRADPRAEVELVAGMSFLDLAWARLGVDPVSRGVRLVDGEVFGVDAAGERGPMLVAQCWSSAVLSGIKLAVEEHPSDPVTVLSHLGLPDEKVFEVSWADLDRKVEPDHLTSLWIPTVAAPVGVELARLAELVRTLRQRCPWDREQTHASLSRHLIEEAYEVVEAIDALEAGGSFAHLAEELGDLLVQVCFHSTLAAEEGQFNLADVASGVHDKLVGRHPHVFGSVSADSSDQVMANWEQIKQVEKGRASVMDGIPTALPALLAASKVLGKASAVGADQRSVNEALADLRGALAGLDGTGEAGPGVGRALLALVGLARLLGVDAEGALRRAVQDYRANFDTYFGQ